MKKLPIVAERLCRVGETNGACELVACRHHVAQEAAGGPLPYLVRGDHCVLRLALRLSVDDVPLLVELAPRLGLTAKQAERAEKSGLAGVARTKGISTGEAAAWLAGAAIGLSGQE